jgi:hypothetical protein
MIEVACAAATPRRTRQADARIAKARNELHDARVVRIVVEHFRDPPVVGLRNQAAQRPLEQMRPAVGNDVNADGGGHVAKLIRTKGRPRIVYAKHRPLLKYEGCISTLGRRPGASDRRTSIPQGKLAVWAHS